MYGLHETVRHFVICVRLIEINPVYRSLSVCNFAAAARSAALRGCLRRGDERAKKCHNDCDPKAHISFQLQ
jgi:hypothetical protein